MPIYEIRYKKRELGEGKRIVEEANIQRAFLMTHKDLPDNEE
jgi:hypothetical protein